ESTQLAALKRGEVDIVYSIRGALAEELRRTPGVQLKATVLQGTFWVYFPEQWDAKSPWHNLKLRQAVSLAFDRNAINQAETLGFSRITNSIVPDIFEFFWKPPAAVYDPAKAKRLLAEAGYPNGFDAGDYTCDVAYANIAEAVQNYLQAVGIRTRLRPLERAISAPIWQLGCLNGVGPRVEESSLGAIPGFAYSGPYEDVKLKK